MRSSNTFLDRFPKLAVALLLCAGAAFAVDPTRAMSQYIRDRWGPEQGFPRGPVYSIAQTADGYLWIGTEAGLVRFDGLNFRLVADATTSFPVKSVLGLATDNENNLWVRLPGPVMLRYRGGAFVDAMTKLGMPYSNVTAMAHGNAGSLLIARLEDETVTYQNGRFRTIAAATPIARSPVLSVAQTLNGDIWMGTRDAGLYRLANNQVTSIAKGLPDSKINCLLPDGEQSLWVGTDNGVVRWNGTELTATAIPPSANRFQTLAMAKDRDGNLWVGTDSRGLLRLNAQGVSLLDQPGKGSGEAVTAIFEDREGNLWIGSASGIERLRDSAFVTYSELEGLPTSGSNPIFVDAYERMWFAPPTGGLWWLKDGQHERVSAGGVDRDVVYSIAGRPGELWLGRQRGGLTQLRGSAAKTYTTADGLAQNSVYSVHAARDGTVWAGTLSAGVSRLQNGVFTTFTTKDGLASNTVAAIAESAEGTIWFATTSGVSAFSNGHWQSFTTKQGLPSLNTNCLLSDSAGVIWAGTAAGLAFRHGESFQVPAGMPPVLREHILGIAEDRYGDLWLATSSHVLRVNREKLLNGKLTNTDVHEYGLADGLHSVEGVKRHSSVVTDERGRIWFSLTRGISMVDPDRLAGRSTPVVVHLQSISADGVPIDLQGPIRIPAGSQRVTLAYAGLSLAIPERVRFRYTLDRFDRGWSAPVAAREAIYTNLNPGHYRFRVIASNPDGVWNSTEASVAFEIEPAFWQAWWFRLGILAAFALSILALYRYRLHGVAQQLNIRFEERLAERTRIAQELHDTLLQGFLSASMQLHIAADNLEDESPAKPLIQRVLQLMSQVVEEGRNAVRGLRSSDLTSHDLGQALSRVQEELGIGEDIDFQVVVEGQVRPLHPLMRDEVYRIGREALVNAFRHSKATRIEIELEYGPKQLIFHVRDNGRGIDQKVLLEGRDGHWGLRGMRERAERIGASLHVWSSAASGTEIELSVPSHVAYQDATANGILSRIFSGRPAGGEKEK